MNPGRRVRNIFVAGSAETIIPMGREIESLGHESVLFEALSFEPVSLTQKSSDNISKIGPGDWIVFSSRNAVRFFLELSSLFKTRMMLNSLKIAAVGPSTEDELKKSGLHVDFLPEIFDSVNLARTLPFQGSQKILIPQARESIPDLEMGLHARGAQVCVVPVYRTIEFSSVDDSLVEILKTKIFDRAIFTSPSSVRSTKKALGSHHAILRKVRTFAIGDATRIELEKHGHEDVETAHTHSGKGIIEKLTEDL